MVDGIKWSSSKEAVDGSGSPHSKEAVDGADGPPSKEVVDGGPPLKKAVDATWGLLARIHCCCCSSSSNSNSSSMFLMPVKRHWFGNLLEILPPLSVVNTIWTAL